MVPVHPREAARLAALHDLDILDTEQEEEFDALCETARDLFQAPIALVSLVGETDQWFKARCGIDLTGTARGVSFCTHTVMSNELLVVEDASRDPRFADSFLVTGDQGIRFYAGAPLEVAPGLQVGSLCVMDRVPRTFIDRQRGQLQTLARIVTAQLRLHKTERLLREREASYRLLADNTTDMVVRADLDGTRRYVSPGCRALLGYEPEALIGTRPLDFVHPDDADAYGVLLGEIARGHIESATTQQRYRHRDGHWVWVEVTFGLYRKDGANKPSGYVASVRDISKRKEAEAQLAHLARHDGLTGLPNRLQFQECLQKEVARARRGRTGFALHCLDLDRFKAINDTFGHPVGDRLLQAVADRLRAAVRTEDTVARLGGDEFVIIQTGTDRAGAVTMAERLIASLSAPFDLGEHRGQIGVSIGIVLADGIACQGEALHSAADSALYEAKAAGRCTFRLSDASTPRRRSRVA
ncbi:sensor domain-containing diguanylate cyclase [Methylorubrum populi]|jgi:diguanylate cyclase (GGDEF)-like protein/PAS domain S-box-containing protein|uniref:Sensor domain-containing diguanylate cyclase n=1 Tax=Methylorubrum rhodesianum TaxID=29427 RepID=A0ABU9Z7U2_9HYPH|nr:sensor domain-containing diguanylate cyclase [Methylorubrum rhodesianum]MBK3403439.1 sensor domain-containing diguanylate cyclase [Methylorubrum rhodesianum]MBY0140335.1 sensor domain-containing diguanylate cyclase [Methylorubrum populi]